ncbi:MAG: glutathione S-transferase family protein [Solirubrobacteraceae bacterium]
MLRLYRFPYSTNVERVALALAYKGLDVEWIDIDPADRSPLREVSGQNLVPVLIDGDRIVTDSTRILHHLEERFPAPPLFPAEPAARAEVEVFLDWFNRAWKREPNLIVDALERGEGEGEDVARWTARMRRRLDLFEGLLDGREHLFGAFGAADCAAWPFLRYAVEIAPGDDERFHVVLHERLALEDRHANLRAWIARVAGRPAA